MDRPPVPAEAMLSGEKPQKISWRRGTKDRLTCLCAARRVRVAEVISTGCSTTACNACRATRWLVGERRSTGEQRYYVSNLPADAPLKRLAATVKARWVCEQAHQQLKEELGLDHFEGRSWTGQSVAEALGRLERSDGLRGRRREREDRNSASRRLTKHAQPRFRPLRQTRDALRPSGPRSKRSRRSRGTFVRLRRALALRFS